MKFKSGTKIDSKGYITITAGPQRDQRLHRLIAEAMLGRKLRVDEDCHHLNGNKLDNRPENLKVLGHKEHGAVSAKQHHWVKTNDVKLKGEYEEYFNDPSYVPVVVEPYEGDVSFDPANLEESL